MPASTHNVDTSVRRPILWTLFCETHPDTIWPPVVKSITPGSKSGDQIDVAWHFRALRNTIVAPGTRKTIELGWGVCPALHQTFLTAVSPVFKEQFPELKVTNGRWEIKSSSYDTFTTLKGQKPAIQVENTTAQPVTVPRGAYVIVGWLKEEAFPVNYWFDQPGDVVHFCNTRKIDIYDMVQQQ